MSEITVPEYILIWIIRAVVIYGGIRLQDPSQVVMYWINTLALFAMTILRFVAPKKSFLARLDFRAQHIIAFFELLGTFFGKYINAYAYIAKYDRLLHLLSGPGAVIAGYFVFKALASKDGKKKIYPSNLAAFSSISFSFVVITIWEIVEFFGDYLFGSVNQGWYYAPAENDIFFRIFGKVADPGQYPLWDTMLDMIDASVTTIISGTVLWVVLKLMEKHMLKNDAKKPELAET